jgi:hypothetical protein
VDHVRKQVDKLLIDSLEVSVGDRSAYIAQQAAVLDEMVVTIQILLALAVLVAVLGIINTMALSVLESCGLPRWQTPAPTPNRSISPRPTDWLPAVGQGVIKS